MPMRDPAFAKVLRGTLQCPDAFALRIDDNQPAESVCFRHEAEMRGLASSCDDPSFFAPVTLSGM